MNRELMTSRLTSSGVSSMRSQCRNRSDQISQTSAEYRAATCRSKKI